MRKIILLLSFLIFTAALCYNQSVSAFAPPDDISAASAIVINADTGGVLYAKNEYEIRAIASTTKIMTALLAIESGDLDRKFVADSEAIKVEGTSMGLREGDIVTRRALLYGLILPSGNDAANALAVSVSGSMSAFVAEMNAKAEALGLEDTHFSNPSGLDEGYQTCTAYDLAMLTREAMKYPLFREICACEEAETEFGNPPEMRTLYNSNKLLAEYDGCIGVKTGFTDNARRCLVSAAEKDGCTLIAVTLNAPDDWDDHKKLLDYCFEMTESFSVEYSGNIPVVNGERESVPLVCAEKITLGLTQDEKNNIKSEVILRNFLYAGFGVGEKAGRLRISLDGDILAEADIITSEACAPKRERLGFFEGIIQFFRQLI